MKILTILLMVFTLTGCAAFTPSYYVNRSNEYENMVSATGKAAENAAIANSSSRGGGGGGGSNSSNNTTSNEYSISDQIMRSTQQAFVSEMNTAIRDMMRDAFR